MQKDTTESREFGREKYDRRCTGGREHFSNRSWMPMFTDGMI
jgi:hypothetical protein